MITAERVGPDFISWRRAGPPLLRADLGKNPILQQRRSQRLRGLAGDVESQYE